MEQSLWAAVPQYMRRLSAALKKHTGHDLPLQVCVRVCVWGGGVELYMPAQTRPAKTSGAQAGGGVGGLYAGPGAQGAGEWMCAKGGVGRHCVPGARQGCGGWLLRVGEKRGRAKGAG